MIRFFFLLACSLLLQTNSFSKTISTADPLLVTLVSLQNPTCLNPAGSITVLATGGTPGYTYTWNTGTNGPVITGLSSGTYEVVVSDSDGNLADLQITVVEDLTAPVAVAGAPLLVPCSNTSTSLNGSGSSSGPEFSYQWVASNGGRLLSGATTLTPVVDLAGNFQLTVTNQNNGCTATDVTTVTGQNIAPSAAATGGVINCYSATVTLTVVYTTLHTTFVWQGPGGFNSNLVNPVVSVGGNYVFNLTDTLTGCLQKSTAVVTSNLVAPNVDGSVNGIITCAQPLVQLTGTSTTPGVTYKWTGPNGYMSNDQNPLVSTAGTYTLTVQNPANGCSASKAVVVTSNLVVPIATAAVNGTLTCVSQIVQLTGMSNTPGVSYAWTGPNNFMSGLQNVGVSTPGLYTLTVKNPVNGCTGTATVTVMQNITPPNASASGGIKTCSSPSVLLTGSSTTPGAIYSWTGPNGFMSSLQNPSVNFAGSYTLKVTHPQNGCTATAIATVTQNITPPSVSATSGTITCTNPLAQINTTSSPQGLTYAWTGPNNFNSSLKNPMVGASGYYYVTVTNPVNGCTNTGSVYTFENTTPPFAYAGEDKSLNCYFSSILINGSFSSNGPNFTYQWTTFDGNIVSGATTLYPTVNFEGTYTLKVTNTQNGCMDKDSMEVTQSTPVTAFISQNIPVFCSGGATGSATVNAGGGSSFYSYLWSNGKTTATNNGLSAGVYTVTVIDTEGCSATASATINQLVLTGAINVTHQSIPGVNNGAASAVGGGGTAPYSAKWSNGALTPNISNLAPGPYVVTLTDAKGCTLVLTTTVNAANCIVTGTISGVNVTCFGANNGSATVNLISAQNPITYAWSNGGSTKTVNGLAPGTYTVTATDASGCPVVQTVQITGPQQLVITVISKSDVGCPSSADGSISVGVSGGVQPYSYQWSNNKTTASISNLSPGTYTLTVTDANNCSGTLSAQINSPIPITISVLSKTNVNCPGSTNGAVSVLVAGGLPPYQYFWSNGSTVSSITGLSPGNYTLTVTDNNDCPKSLSTQILVLDKVPPTLVLQNATVELDNNGVVSISAPLFDNGSSDDCGITSWTITPNSFNCSQTGQHIVTITATDPSGNTSSGSATVTVLDNVAPIVFCPSNITTGSCNQVVQFNLPQVSDNCQILPAQLLQVSGYPSGATFPVGNTLQSYQYTDLAGNVGQCSFQVIVGEAVTFSSATIPTNCSNDCTGAASFTQISGGGFNLAWSNGQTGLSITGLCPGTYTATITDTYNCIQTQTLVVAVMDQQAPSLSCPGNIVGSYCAPITYNLPVVTDNCAVNLNALQLLSGLPSGVLFPVGTTQQVYTYVDGGGNSVQCSFNVSITGPPTANTGSQDLSCANQCNGSASLSLSGGSGPFNIQWSNGQTGPIATNLCAGNYSYVLSDFFGCILTGSVAVNQPPVLQLSVDQVLNDQGNSGLGNIQISVTGGVSPYTFNWTRNGQFFASSEDLGNLFQGQYLGIITDANGCTNSTGTITVTNTVGTKAPEWTHSLILSPNPALEMVYLDFEAPIGQDAELRISDLNGRVVLIRQINASTQQVQFDVSTFSAGLWLVKLSLADGKSTVRKLVVVK